MIRFETSLGDFTIELFEKEAPESAANFTRYIDEGFFDGTIFRHIFRASSSRGEDSRRT